MIKMTGTHGGPSEFVVGVGAPGSGEPDDAGVTDRT